MFFITTLVLLALALAYCYHSRKRPCISVIGHPKSGTPSAFSTGRHGVGDGAKTEKPTACQTFRYPPIDPCPTHLDHIEPRIYRPFKPGPYNLTMGIRPMSWEEWIEVDRLYERYHAIRARRIETRGSKVARYLPPRQGLVNGGEDAARELSQELAHFLGKRYPGVFHVEYDGDGAGPDSISKVTILPLNITYDLAKENPLDVVAKLAQEDFAILIEGTDGKYYLVGGAILVAGSWRLDEKIGMSLDEIHLSGNVPQYEQKLQSSLTKFFRRLAVDTPYARNNYSFQVVDRTAPDALDPDELAWCATTNGLEDAEPPACPDALGPGRVSPHSILFRTERQTLRRLPRTGAVVFSIRTYLAPLDELAREPGVPARLAQAVRGWSDDIWAYKKGNLYGEELLKYLDSLAQASPSN